MKRVILCRACRRGECEDCIRWTYEGAGCDHLCADKRQLGLFPVSDGQRPVYPPTSTDT